MKNAIVIPIYSGHFARFSTLINTIEKISLNDCSIVFISSTYDEQIRMLRYIGPDRSHIMILNLEQLAMSYLNLDSTQLEQFLRDSNSVVNLKKLLGLLNCFERGHKCAVAIDSDTMILNNFNSDRFFNDCQKNYLKQIFYGKKHTEIEGLYTEIIHKSMTMIGLDTRDINNAFYNWFFDVPYYESNDFMDFIIYLNNKYGDKWWFNLSWFTFDHLVYSFFLISQKDWKFQSYTNISDDFPEDIRSHHLFKIYQDHDYYPVWIRHRTLSEMPELKALNSKIQMVYHMDR